MWLAEKGGQVYKHPYDIGAYENLTLVIILIYIFRWSVSVEGLFDVMF